MAGRFLGAPVEHSDPNYGIWFLHNLLSIDTTRSFGCKQLLY